MTLRITLEIVPHGNEAEKRIIYQFDIWNMGSQTKHGKTRYAYRQVIPDVAPWDIEQGKMLHRRSSGAVGLARKLLARFEPSTGMGIA